MPHSIPKLLCCVMKPGISEGPSTNVWSNHLRRFWSFFDMTKDNLRVSILHPICILVKLGRVIRVRQVPDSEGDILGKVLGIVPVPFCKSIIKERDRKETNQQTAQQIESGFGRHLSTLCPPSRTTLQSPFQRKDSGEIKKILSPPYSDHRQKITR